MSVFAFLSSIVLRRWHGFSLCMHDDKPERELCFFGSRDVSSAFRLTSRGVNDITFLSFPCV